MKIVTILTTTLLSLLVLAGCEEGPAEDAVEDLSSSMEEVGESLDSAMDGAKEQLDKAKKELEEAIEQ
jgi:outer membrane murein-binding lipoprotein Lpp